MIGIVVRELSFHQCCCGFILHSRPQWLFQRLSFSSLPKNQSKFWVDLVKKCLNSLTIDKLGEWCLERRVRPRMKLSRTRKVSITTLWAAATHQAPSQWQVSENTNTYHILTKARGRDGARVNSQCELFNETQIACHPKPGCKPCGAPAHNSRPPHTRTLGDTAGQHCLAFNLA